MNEDRNEVFRAAVIVGASRVSARSCALECVMDPENEFNTIDVARRFGFDNVEAWGIMDGWDNQKAILCGDVPHKRHHTPILRAQIEERRAAYDDAYALGASLCQEIRGGAQ